MKLSKGKKFWFKKDYSFDHASGEKENLLGRLFTCNSIKNKLIHCTDNRGRAYLLPFEVKQFIHIQDGKISTVLSGT